MKTMTEDYKEFIASFENPNTRKAVTAKRIIDEYDYSQCTTELLEEVILKTSPRSLKTITSTCTILKWYAKFLGNQAMISQVENLDRKKLWEKIKPNVAQKFISHRQFEEVFMDISQHAELNVEYQLTLLRAIYEGIYCSDMYVLRNLRRSDVDGNTVTLCNRNEEKYTLEVSSWLSEHLIRMSKVNTTERKNDCCYFEVRIEGPYHDSCFKSELRGGVEKENTYKNHYNKVIAKIAKEYIGFSITPAQIFVSGIMYRLKISLDTIGISIEEAFSENNQNPMVNQAIQRELDRCNYNIKPNAFRELVIGHTEIFK